MTHWYVTWLVGMWQDSLICDMTQAPATLFAIQSVNFASFVVVFTMLISYGEYSKGPLDYVPWEVKARTAIHLNTSKHALQYTWTQCITLTQDTARHRKTLQHTAPHWNTTPQRTMSISNDCLSNDCLSNAFWPSQQWLSQQCRLFKGPAWLATVGGHHTHCITQQHVHTLHNTATRSRTASHSNMLTHCITQQVTDTLHDTARRLNEGLSRMKVSLEWCSFEWVRQRRIFRLYAMGGHCCKHLHTRHCNRPTAHTPTQDTASLHARHCNRLIDTATDE